MPTRHPRARVPCGSARAMVPGTEHRVLDTSSTVRPQYVGPWYGRTMVGHVHDYLPMVWYQRGTDDSVWLPLRPAGNERAASPGRFTECGAKKQRARAAAFTRLLGSVVALPTV